VTYEAEGWGVGEIWVDGEQLVHHELPRPRRSEGSDSHSLARRLQRYFRGERIDFVDVELDLSWATPFQRAIAEALRDIPYGESVTYGELAALAGHPNAQRAAGTFCARNRFAVVVPCHRVVPSVGGIGKYGGQEWRKQFLLQLEGAVATQDPA